MITNNVVSGINQRRSTRDSQPGTVNRGQPEFTGLNLTDLSATVSVALGKDLVLDQTSQLR